MEEKELKSVVEAILFATGRPIMPNELAANLDVEEVKIESVCEQLKVKYEVESSGISIVKVKNGYQMVTNKDYYKYVSDFLATTKKENLSPTLMEVLSIIAYNPKITKAEIEKIRGTNSDSQVSRLLEYGLVEEVGRLQAPGRPAMFEVTLEFLRAMGLNSVEDLPDFDKLNNKDVDLDSYRQE